VIAAASTNQQKGHPCGGLFVDGDGVDENPRSGFDKRCGSSAQDVARRATGRSAARRPSHAQQAHGEHSRRLHQFLTHNYLINIETFEFDSRSTEDSA
jgi:hypothetical protein